MRCSLAISLALLLGACDTEPPAVEDAGPPDGALPGRCGTLTCSADGVCLENAPTKGARINGIWGSGPSDVFLVGDGGMVLRFDGQAWKAMSSGVSVTLYDVWGLGPTEVHAVGSAGTALRFNGKAWSAAASGTKAALRGVWGSGPSRVFAVGGDGKASVGLRFDGKAWSAVAALARDRVTLLDVHGDGTKRAAAVGYYYDGNAYNMANHVACKLASGKWTCAPPGDAGELYGAYLLPGSDNFLVGTCCQDKLRCGGLIQTTGVSSCTPGDLQRTVQYHAVWGSGPSDIWVAGSGGRLIRHAGVTGEWPRLKTDNTAVLRTVWGDGVDVLVGGDHGVLLRRCGP